MKKLCMMILFCLWPVQASAQEIGSLGVPCIGPCSVQQRVQPQPDYDKLTRDYLASLERAQRMQERCIEKYPDQRDACVNAWAILTNRLDAAYQASMPQVPFIINPGVAPPQRQDRNIRCNTTPQGGYYCYSY